MTTEQIQSLIDRTAAANGGTATVPAGDHHCGPLELKSGARLVLEQGARILAAWDVSAELPKGFITAAHARDIEICGPGTIDARGGMDSFPKGTPHRPRGFHLHDCENVRIAGIHFRDAPSWGLHFSECTDLTIDGVTIDNHNNYNNDGIDISDCHGVRITNCDISSDDDGIVIKSFTARGNRDIEVAHCTVGSHCNALKTGTESYGSFKNIEIHDCTVVPARSETVYYGSVQGQSAICLTNVDGADLADVHVHDIEIRSGTRIPLCLRLGARLRPYANDTPRPVGTFKKVTIENITAHNSLNSGYACTVAGVAVDGGTHYLENIVLRNLDLRFVGETAPTPADLVVAENPSSYPHPNILGALPAYGLYCRHVKGLVLDSVNISHQGGAENRPPVLCEDVQARR